MKNYNYVNKFGRVIWAKIVTQEFKGSHVKVMGTPTMREKSLIEQSIVKEYITESLVRKEYEKLDHALGQPDDWDRKNIPRLLNTIFHCLIQEKSWNFIKKLKNPTINYNILRGATTIKVRELMPELF